MSTRAVMSVAVKLLGLHYLLWGIRGFYHVTGYILQEVGERNDLVGAVVADGSRFLRQAASVLVLFLIAVLLIGGAEWIASRIVRSEESMPAFEREQARGILFVAFVAIGLFLCVESLGTIASYLARGMSRLDIMAPVTELVMGAYLVFRGRDIIRRLGGQEALESRAVE